MEGSGAECLHGGAGEWSVGSEGLSWRLLAALEVGTLLLVGLALLLHALRARAAGERRALRGQRVLITKGETPFSQELARHFTSEGCSVSLVADSRDSSAAEGEVLRCDIRQREEVSRLAAGVSGLDVLVVCGAEPGNSGLDELAKAVSEEVYANFHLLEELGGRMRPGGRIAWVCAAEGAASRGASRNYAGAARSLQQLARALLHEVARRSGCRAVWCSARGDSGGALAARVVRTVARDGSLPPSADVFRELGYKLRDVIYDTFSRFCKIWT